MSSTMRRLLLFGWITESNIYSISCRLDESSRFRNTRSFEEDMNERFSMVYGGWFGESSSSSVDGPSSGKSLAAEYC